MTASLWAPGTQLASVNAAFSLKHQYYTAINAQVLFNITAFQYAPNTGSLLIFKNGLALQSGVDFQETSATAFTLAVGATVGDSITALGFVGIIGSLGTLAAATFSQNTTYLAGTAGGRFKERVSVEDAPFNAVPGLGGDATTAIQAAATFANAARRPLYFPSPVYIVKDQILIDVSCVGWKVYGSGNGGAAGTGYGTKVQFDPTVGDINKAVFKFTGASCATLDFEDMEIDANSKAGMCINQGAPQVLTTGNKLFQYTNLELKAPMRAGIVIGDATWDGGTGDYVNTTHDADAFMNTLTHVHVTPMATTLYGAVVNVLNNAYQTTFRDFVVEGTLAQMAGMINAIRSKAGNNTHCENCYSSRMPNQAANVAVFGQNAGSMKIIGGGSEEGRVLYRSGVATEFNNTFLKGFDVNDSHNMDSTAPKYSIYNTTGSPITVEDCHLHTGAFFRKVYNVPGTPLVWRNNSVADTITFEGAAPSDSFIPVPFDAANFGGTGAMTWVLTAPDQTTYEVSMDGYLMKLNFCLFNTTIAGVVDTQLKIKIPFGRTALERVMVPFKWFNNAVEGVGVAEVDAGDSWIYLYKTRFSATNYVAEVNLCAVVGTIEFTWR